MGASVAKIEHFCSIHITDLTVSSVLIVGFLLLGAFGIGFWLYRRIAAVAALQESESRYRDLVEHSSDLICTHDFQGILLSINEAPLRILGYTREEMLNRQLKDFVTVEAKAKCDEYLAEVQREGFAHGILPVLTKSGEVRLWEYNNSVRKDGVSSPIVRGLAHDVTEQKQIESALRRSEEKFSKAFRSSPVEMVITTLEDGRFVEVNESFERNLGFRREEAIGRTVLELGLWVNPGERKRIVQEIRQANRVINQEVQIRGKSGEARFKLYSAESITIGGEKCLLAVSEDIEDRKRAETNLFRSQAFLAEAQRLTHTGSWSWSPDSGEVKWSIETFRIFGLDPEVKLSVELFLERVHQEDRPRVENTWCDAVAQRVNFEVEYRIVLDGKSVKFIQSVGRPVFNPSGEFLYFMGTAMDVTERKHAEAELQRLSSQLLRMHEEERRDMARELHDTTGQDLIVLKTNLALLEPSIPIFNRKLRKLLNESRKLANRCIRDLRALSYVLYPPMLDETGLGDAIGHYLQGFSERTGIDVRLDMPPDFARLPRSVEVTCFRVMQECLSNIHRHSGSSKASVRLERMRLERSCEAVSMQISDSGRGISAYDNGTKRPCIPRAGVGIPVMYERVKQVGGQLKIESGKLGTTVRLVIPLGETIQ